MATAYATPRPRSSFRSSTRRRSWPLPRYRTAWRRRWVATPGARLPSRSLTGARGTPRRSSPTRYTVNVLTKRTRNTKPPGKAAVSTRGPSCHPDYLDPETGCPQRLK